MSLSGRKMKRFIKVYLTLLVVTVLATNLVLVLLYGQHFLFKASDGAAEEGVAVQAAAFYLNATVLLVFLVFWLIAYYHYKRTNNHPADYR
jgi:hypothetical protein